MKNLSKIIATGMLFSSISTSYADSELSKIEALEARISKMEKVNKNSIKIDDFLTNHEIFGVLQFDATMIANNNGNILQNKSQLRRGKIGIQGEIAQGWGYKYEVDFGNKNSRIQDAYIKKSLFDKKATLKIGQFKETFSFEELTDSKFLTFLERSTINGIVRNHQSSSRRLGIGYDHHFENVNFYSGVFNSKIGGSSSSDDSDISATTRLAFYNKSKNKDVIHFGISYKYFEPAGDAMTYQVKPEASIGSSANAISANLTSSANQVNQAGLELAAIYGPFTFQGERIESYVDLDDGFEDYMIRGYYAQLSYFLTNDKRSYDEESSTFGRVKPNSKKGAWEIAYRFSNTNANYKTVQKGDVESNTFGVNYYATDNVRFLANYIDLNVDSNANYNGDAEIASIRAQIDF